MAADNDDVALEDFAGMQRQHLAAANNQIRLGTTGRASRRCISSATLGASSAPIKEDGD
jgi:hypothetical protein